MLKVNDFNPRTPCGVRPAPSLLHAPAHRISIHAPLAGCDPPSASLLGHFCISIHAPLAGCDCSRLSAFSIILNFNPRTPCGVRRAWPRPCAAPYYFNPRTPCGVRPPAACRWWPVKQFQSTHPLRGATRRTRSGSPPKRNFNPRTPCGVRLPCLSLMLPTMRFQSTHPLRGATTAFGSSTLTSKDFNPRTPCGVRQQNCRNIPGKFAQKLQNFCKAEQRAALPRVGQRESGCYFRPCAVRTSRGKPEHFRFASDNERALRSVARLCAEVLDAGFILVSKVIKA